MEKKYEILIIAPSWHIISGWIKVFFLFGLENRQQRLSSWAINLKVDGQLRNTHFVSRWYKDADGGDKKSKSLGWERK